MANPLYDMLGGSMPPIVKQFLQFKSTFQGDARQQVEQLLNNGSITQDQYNKAVQEAQALQQMLSLSGRK